MAKSSTRKKPKLPKEVTQTINVVSDLVTDYIKYWTDREINRISSEQSVPICLQTPDGYRIGAYRLRILPNKTCELYDIHRELIHVFENKLSAVLYTIYTIKKSYKMADEIMLWDQEINKNYADVQSLRRGLLKARKQKEYDLVDIRNARLELAESRLSYARDKISNLHNHAKYMKVWG